VPYRLLEAGHALLDLGARAVLVKGRHIDGDECIDILFRKGFSGPRYFFSRRIHTRNDHGTGCTLATSIASGLAVRIDLPIAISRAREFVQDAYVDRFICRTVQGEGPWIYWVTAQLTTDLPKAPLVKKKPNNSVHHSPTTGASRSR
jgi:hydroxymethylpyrimidine/phosphomethylpyrimidine kinase